MFLRQLLLVVLKNFRLQVRRPLVTILELLFPIIAAVVVVIIRYSIPQFQTQKQCFVTFESDYLIQPFTGEFTVFYTPNNTDTQFVASIIESQLNGGKLIGVEAENDIVDGVERLTDNRIVGCFLNGAGIIFELNGTDISYTLRLRHETPTREEYRTSWFTKLTSPLSAPSGPRIHDNAYFNEGFLHLQHFTSLAIIEFIAQRRPYEIQSISMKQLPYPQYTIDDFLVYVGFILPFVIMGAYLLSVGLFTKDLVREKETRMRQMLKTMGLSNFVLGFGWLIKQTLFLLVPSIIFTLILKYSRIFPNSNPVALMILILCYLASMISFSFLVSVWFNSSRLGMMAAFIFWFFTYIPHLFISQRVGTLAIEFKLLACLLSNTCVGMAVDVISTLELREDGFQFVDFYSKLSADDSFNMYAVIGMLLLNTLLHFLLAWYVSEIKPGEYGIPQKLYFPFQLSYWTGKPSLFNRKTKVASFNTTSTEDLLAPSASTVTGLSDGSAHNSAHEMIHPEREIGIELKGVKKVFKAHQYSGRAEIIAVNDVSLKIYKGQITVLLGHNAAGKSTLLSLITSFYPPNEGTVKIDGVDLVKNRNSARANIGICPQYNLLFDNLSVEEHLNFFASLKGSKNVNAAVAKTIQMLELQNDSKKKASELSGGLKRKLNLGIALIGDPDVLILDEPTSGMDFVASNLTWKILQERRRSNRTILLTTHNLDDAEKADRIVMMVEGKIACSGSPRFLKKRYGVGYSLRIDTANEELVSEIVDKVQLTCPKSEKYQFKTQLHFLLPYEEISMFSSLFKWIEKCHEEGKVTNFSVQENRMLDAFIEMRKGHSISWDSRIKTISKIISQAPTISSHRPILPSLTINSIDSFDLNTQFQGTEQADGGMDLETIDEEGSGYPVGERRRSSRSSSFSGSPVSTIPNHGRNRSSSIASSVDYHGFGNKGFQATPSILKPIYENDNDNDAERADMQLHANEGELKF